MQQPERKRDKKKTNKKMTSLAAISQICLPATTAARKTTATINDEFHYVIC